MDNGTMGQAPVTAPETTFVATVAPAAEPTQTSAPDTTGRTEPTSATTDGTTGKTADPAVEIDLGVDINSLPEEARAYALKAERDMKAAYTRKAQELAAHRNKVAEYDQFMANPVESLQRLAAQYGFSVSPAQAAQALQAQGAPEEWQPNDWNEVLDRAAQKAKAEALAEFKSTFKPFLETVQQQQQKNIESQLSSIDPDWRNYEGEMVAILKEHPTMAKNVEKLYRLAVPPDVIEARATKAAIERMQKNANAARVSSTSTTKSTPAQQEAKTFAEAVELAKAQLSSQTRR